MFRTLLIANRGEIACRIARTARRLGIETVAVFSDADANALHVRHRRSRPAASVRRRRARAISTSPASSPPRGQSGAQAIHPGYGFLSENPDFAEACAAAGLVFVGPPAGAMRAMGSKSAAKTLMQRSGVPLLPGYHGDNQDPAFLAAQAGHASAFRCSSRRCPAAAARGMRVVDARRGSSTPRWREARQEAPSAFGDDRVLIERYLHTPAPHRGAGLRRHARQRRASVRARLLGAAPPSEGDRGSARARHRSARAAPRWARPRSPRRARSAMSAPARWNSSPMPDGFFFLEMNTRLQVEHPVTEMVTGFDLVEWQLRVAAGETLPATQDAIRLTGHAIEARLYAEDPARDFAAVDRPAGRVPPASRREPMSYRHRFRRRRRGVDPLRRRCSPS